MMRLRHTLLELSNFRDRCGHGPERRLVAAEWNLVVLSKAEADGGGAEVSARG